MWAAPAPSTTHQMLLLKLDGRERQQFEESRWLWASSPWRPGLCWSNRFSCLVMPQPSDITRDESIPHRWNCPNNWSLLPFFPRFLIVLILYSCYRCTYAIPSSFFPLIYVDSLHISTVLIFNIASGNISVDLFCWGCFFSF